jgi:hypothetical protein
MRITDDDTSTGACPLEEGSQVNLYYMHGKSVKESRFIPVLKPRPVWLQSALVLLSRQVVHYGIMNQFAGPLRADLF